MRMIFDRERIRVAKYASSIQKSNYTEMQWKSRNVIKAYPTLMNFTSHNEQISQNKLLPKNLTIFEPSPEAEIVPIKLNRDNLKSHLF